MAALSPPAFAGHYDVSYSGGTVVVTTMSGGSQSTPYALDSNSYWGGSNTAYWHPPFSSGGGSATGQITTTFTWHADYTGEPAPSSAIVAEESHASWQCSASNAYGSASSSDGLGDAEVPGYASGASDGNRYTVKDNPGSSFTITCSPDAHMYGGSGLYGYGPVAVRYKASATPVTIDVAGTTNVSSIPSVLIGQHLSATLSTGGYTQSNWQWSIAGADPFAGFQVTQTTGQALELTAAMKQNATFGWYYRSLGGAAGNIPSDITCTATIKDPKNVSHAVTAKTTVKVYEPAHQFLKTAGTVDVWDFVTYKFLGPYNADTRRGIEWNASATTSSNFIGEEGVGIYAYAQIITPTYNYTDANNTLHTFPQNGQTGSDGTFYYQDFTADANGTLKKSGDIPGVNLTGKLGADMSASFKTYMLYRPPDATGAAGTTWVPLHELDWNFHGGATYNNTQMMWVLYTNDGITITKDSKTSTLPSWTQVINLSNF